MNEDDFDGSGEKRPVKEWHAEKPRDSKALKDSRLDLDADGLVGVRRSARARNVEKPGGGQRKVQALSVSRESNLLDLKKQVRASAAANPTVLKPFFLDH